jgi:hypothetical protein
MGAPGWQTLPENSLEEPGGISKRWCSVPTSGPGSILRNSRQSSPRTTSIMSLPGEPIHDFFEAWKRSAAQNLADRGYKINMKKKWLANGRLLLEEHK